MPGTSTPISAQRRRLRWATSSSAPLRRPPTHTRPKLRTDAPVGAGLGLQLLHGVSRPTQFDGVPGAENASAGNHRSLHVGSITSAFVNF